MNQTLNNPIFGFAFTYCIFFSSLTVPAIYFVFTFRKPKKYKKEMIRGVLLLLVLISGVILVEEYYRKTGNQDYLYTWYYCIPVNLLGFIYFFTIPLWSSKNVSTKNGA